jgi:ABC-2 type transport system permease protein
MNVKGTYTLFKKEIIRVLSIWKQTVIAPVITNLLFLVIFGVALSERTSGFEGFEYLAVLVPGLVAMGIMINALQNPMSSLIIAKYTNAIDLLLMLPLHGWEIAVAYISGGILRGVMVGAATLIAGTFFVTIPFAHIPLILLFAAMLGGFFAAVGLIIGIVSSDFDKANIIPTFVLTPLIYLGGVFYPVGSLPGIFGTISQFNPLFYLIDGFRYSFLGVSETPLALSLGITFSLFAIAFAIASWMFQTGYKLRS